MEYDEVYTIKIENPLTKEESLERKITFETRYYKVKQDHMTQVIKDSTLKNGQRLFASMENNIHWIQINLDL